MTGLFDAIDGTGAEFSSDRVYRYTLTREWEDGQCVSFLLFNPSTATERENDPIIRRCIGFAKRWGFGRLIILNLYAVRSKNPKAVGRMGESATGPLNNYWIQESIKEAREIVCAWGCAQHAPNINRRIKEVMKLVTDYNPDMPVTCLGLRKDGHPRHPLMLPYEMQRVEFSWGNNRVKR